MRERVLSWLREVYDPSPIAEVDETAPVPQELTDINRELTAISHENDLLRTLLGSQTKEYNTEIRRLQTARRLIRDEAIQARKLTRSHRVQSRLERIEKLARY